MNDRPEWFASKRYGLGAGLPISWQGWSLLAVVTVIIVGAGIVLDGHPAAQAAIVIPVLALFILICAKTTRGGWRWRWGEKD